MATYTVQGPSGKTYTIEGPDGATADQLGAHILSQSHDERLAAQVASDRAQYNPTNDMSTSDRVLSGIGSGMTSVLRAVGGGALANKIGLPSSQDEAAALDAPLMATRAGKVGDVLGKAAAVVPLAAAATTAAPALGAGYGGAAVLGAGLGAATTEGDVADRAKGAALGAAGGVVGQGIGQAVGAGVSRIANAVRTATANRAVQNAGRDAAVTTAQQAGYTLPPTEINPSMVNSALEGLSGKIKTSQSASARNQSVTNDLAARSVGLPTNQPITPQALAAVRQQAGQAYQDVANSGVITPTPAYEQALDAITAPYRVAAQGFPNAAPNPIIGTIDSLRSPQFDASAAVAQIRNLREAADTAFSSGQGGMGRSLRQGADALEDAIDTHLTQTGAPVDMLQNFRDARQLIARTHTVGDALNVGNGDVSAKSIGGALQKGAPLTDELLQIGQTARAFPKATQALPQNYNAVSPLDYLAGTAGAAAGHPLAALATFGRPLVRSAILSAPYQRIAAAGQYTNPFTALMQLGSQGFGRIAPTAGALTATGQTP